MRKVATLPTLGTVSVTFHCSSEKVIHLYEKSDEFNRQKGIRQLGLISTVFEGASHSRYEYLMLQCCLADLLDNVHKGSATAAQGELSYNGERLKGNALLKTWFLLSNYGHAKNTIGDEKSLMLFALRRRGFKSALLSPIRDDALRKWSEKVIDEFAYTEFHHILSLRRIYKKLPRQLEKQKYISSLYKLLLLDKDELGSSINHQKLDQLKRLFNTVRALSIVKIDGHYSHSPISMDLMSTILSVDSSEHSYTGKFLIDEIKPVLSGLHEAIYLDRKVLARQRAYELSSLKYLNTIDKNLPSYESAIERALQDGLVVIDSCNLTHFARLPISKVMQPETPFYHEFGRCQTVKRRCIGVEASLDVNPITMTRYADFYIDLDAFSPSVLPRFIYNILILIRAQIRHLIGNTSSEFGLILDEIEENAISKGVDKELVAEIIRSSTVTIGEHAWKMFKSEIFPAFKDLFWSILSYFIEDKYHIDIDSDNSIYDVFAMRFPDGDIGLQDNIENAIQEENSDADRVHEIRQLLASVNRVFEGYIFVCLARIRIFDPTQPPARRLVTDIDSAVIKVSREHIIMELNEAKNTRVKKEVKAMEEIREKLVPILNKNATGYRVRVTKGYGAKLVIKCHAED